MLGFGTGESIRCFSDLEDGGGGYIGRGFHLLCSIIASSLNDQQLNVQKGVRV
jgi:hypothetical protein